MLKNSDQKFLISLSGSKHGNTQERTQEPGTEQAGEDVFLAAYDKEGNLATERAGEFRL